MNEQSNGWVYGQLARRSTCTKNMVYFLWIVGNLQRPRKLSGGRELYLQKKQLSGICLLVHQFQLLINQPRTKGKNYFSSFNVANSFVFNKNYFRSFNYQITKLGIISTSKCCLFYWFTRTSMTNIPQTEWVQQQQFIFSCLWRLKPQIQVSPGLF